MDLVNILRILPIPMVIIGALFMLASIFVSMRMFSSLPKMFLTRWKILSSFMVFFFAGYLAFVFILAYHLPLPVELLTGVVFLFGALFVFMVIKLTKKTVAQLKMRSILLHKSNEHLEKRVELRTQELDKLNDELSVLLNIISSGIRVINRNFVVIKVNKTFLSLVGASEEEIIGKKCFETFHETWCAKKETCTMKRILDGERIIQEDVTRTRKDNSILYCQLTAVPLLGADGSIIGVLEEFRDISKRIEAEKEKERLQAQILHAQKLESVGQLAAGIAHEINTPIQYVGTNIDFLDEAFQDVDNLVGQFQQVITKAKELGVLESERKKAEECLEELDWQFMAGEIPQAINQSQDGIKRVTIIVQAMKEFSHPGSKEKSPNNLNKIIENTITIASNEWKYVAEMDTDLDPDLPLVPCLSEEIGQVVLNMVVNAAHAIRDKAGDKEGVTGKISIKTRHDDQWVGMSIHDEGSGMSEDVRAKIFDPFFTTKEVGSGTGQGLAIAHDVITKHGGRINVRSTEGKGTTFIVKLPLAEMENE